MKKILFLLLCTVSMYGQIVPTGQEQDFDYGIKNTASQLDDNAGFITVQDATGVQGKSTSSVWAKKVYVDNAVEVKAENSAGAIQGFAITNNGDGTVNIATGTAYLRATNDPYAPLMKYTIPAVTNLALTDNANNFVLVDYNGGVPALTVTIAPGTINTTTNSIAYLISRVGTTLDYINLVGQNVDANGKLRRRFLNSESLRRASGVVLTASSRNLLLTAGLFYSGLIEATTPAFNTSTGSTFTQTYLNGSTWVRTTGNTQINNTQYSLAGVLTAMPSNDYRVDYVYVLADNPSKLYVLLGTTTYNNITSARLAPVPVDLPTELQYLGARVGRVIIQKDATTTETTSEFATIYQAGAAQLHNDLGGLNLGDFQHLTVAEKANLELIANKQNSLVIDGSGVKYPTVDAVNAALPADYATIVYVNTTSPNTATIFDDENPPVTNDDALKINVSNLYIGTDSSSWVYNGSIYVTKEVPRISNFYLQGSTKDAGNNKTSPIERFGTIKTPGFIKTGGLVSEALLANGAVLTNPISGTGTTNYIPKFTGTTTLGNSQIFDNGTNVGIGTTSMLAKLDVNGSVKGTGFRFLGTEFTEPMNASTYTQVKFQPFSGNKDLVFLFAPSGTSTTSVMEFYSNSSLAMGDRVIFKNQSNIFKVGGDASNIPLTFIFSNTEKARFAPSGALLLNTTTDNGTDKLQVNGSVSATSYTGSAALTGTPTAPTATSGTNTTQIATTAFVQGEISTAARWTASGNDIYNSNSGNVGIGTAAVPTKAKFEVKGVGGTGAIASFNDATGVERFRFEPSGSFVSVSVNTSQISEGSGGAVLKFNNNPNYFNFTTELPINLGTQRNIIGIIQAFNNTSGSQALNLINLSPTINQTGTSTSIMRSLYINPTLTSAVDFRAIEVTAGDTRLQKVIANNVVRLKNYTVATLPTGTQGDTAYVTDATAPTYLGALTGGGSVVCPVFYNGTSWVSH